MYRSGRETQHRDTVTIMRIRRCRKGTSRLFAIVHLLTLWFGVLVVMVVMMMGALFFAEAVST